MGLVAISSPKLAPPVGPFSPAIASGSLIFLSGQVAQDAATGRLVEGGIAAEVEQIFRNLSAMLEAANRGFQHVVRVGVFLTRMEDFGTVNEIYARHFAPPYPARTTVAVAALPLGASVEIDVIAVGEG